MTSKRQKLTLKPEAKVAWPLAILAIFFFLGAVFPGSVLFPAGCGNNETGADRGSGSQNNSVKAAAMSDFALVSNEFGEGNEIPRVHACTAQGGNNQSPPLSWSSPPAGTSGYALFLEDEDPPCGKGDKACRHWSVFNLPSGVTRIEAGQDIERINGAAEGSNYLGQTGYAGPCPPSRHTYTFTIFALASGMPAMAPGADLTRSQFESEYRDYILGSATLTGSFGT